MKLYRLRAFVHGFWTWLDEILPAQCPNCGHWQSKGTMPWANHSVAGHVQICTSCHADLYGQQE